MQFLILSQIGCFIGNVLLICKRKKKDFELICITLVKNDSLDFYNGTKNIYIYIYKINAVLLYLLFIKESWIKYQGLHKNIKQHNCFQRR